MILGGLANEPRFFGDNIAETISIPSTAANSGWQADYAYSVASNIPWFMLGGESPNQSSAGIFSFVGRSGNMEPLISHRTILLGY